LCETLDARLAEAKEFAERVHAKFPAKSSPANITVVQLEEELDDATIAAPASSGDGYKFQFVTLSRLYALNPRCSSRRGYQERGMPASAELQEAEPAAEPHGYTATRHQRGRHGPLRPGHAGRTGGASTLALGG
jgi:isocitrate lyase